MQKRVFYQFQVLGINYLVREPIKGRKIQNKGLYSRMERAKELHISL